MMMSTKTDARALADTQAVQALKGRISGDVTLPGDAGYDDARSVWNGMINRYPSIIIHCASTDDVVNALGFAREQNLQIAVRSGGHSVAGHGTSEGGAVIDLSPMKGIDVDPERKVARVQGGVTWGELDAATQEHGLATPGGVYSDTGVSGLTLGGGFGWIRNKFGLSCDNLIGAEVVLADGSTVRASMDENQDLLWALRGGGGNFGIVTEFEFQLHPLGPDVMMAFVFHDGEGDKMTKALRYYRDFALSAPDEIGTIAACGKIPPVEDFPEEIHNHPFVLFGAIYAGPAEEGERALKPLIEYDEPLVDLSGVMPYVEAQQMFDEEYPDGLRYYWKSLNLDRFDDDVIDRVVKHARKQVSVASTIDIWHNAGEITRKGPEDGAFFGRNAPFMINPEANWEDPKDDDANIRWARDLIADLSEFSDGSRYLNFAGFQEEGELMMKDAFGPHYQRLAEVKAKYDPE
ncbi:MAG: FAD-binding oxidoreductase, partial [Chloroflexota bacterium]